MSKNSKKNRDSESAFTPKPKKFSDAIGPFTVIVDVFGPKLDAKGNETPHVDPAQSIRVNLSSPAVRDGGSVHAALGKLRPDKKSPEPFYTIVSVTDHGKEKLAAIQATVMADTLRLYHPLLISIPESEAAHV